MTPADSNYQSLRLALRYIIASMITTILSSLAVAPPPNAFLAILALSGLSYMAYAALRLLPRRHDLVREIYLLLAIASLGITPFLGWPAALDLLWGGSFLIGALVGYLILTTPPTPPVPEEW